MTGLLEPLTAAKELFQDGRDSGQRRLYHGDGSALPGFGFETSDRTLRPPSRHGHPYYIVLMCEVESGLGSSFYLSFRSQNDWVSVHSRARAS